MLKLWKNNTKLFRFFFVSAKTKYNRNTQPGLTRYDWANDDFEEHNTDVKYFLLKITSTKLEIEIYTLYEC